MTAVAYVVIEAKDATDFNTQATAQIAAGQFPIGQPFLNKRSLKGKRLCQAFNNVSNGITALEVVVAADPTGLAAAVATAVTASWFVNGFPIVDDDDPKGKFFIQAMTKGGSSVDTFDPGLFHAVVPTTGNTIALTPKALVNVENVNPAGTLAALTLTIADGNIDGQVQKILFTKITTALTCSGANLSTTGLALPTATTAGQLVQFVWSSTLAAWVRVA